MEISVELARRLKRLGMSGMLVTMPERAAYAKKTKLEYTEFLELLVQDEIDRRDVRMLNLRLQAAGLELDQTFETFDWQTKTIFDRSLVKNLFSLAFLEKAENAIFMGPVGVGKTHLAHALGHAAARLKKRILGMRAASLFKGLLQARGDHTYEKEMRRLLGADLLIIDDFGLKRLDHQESLDFYELVIERHNRASTIVTSNREVGEWVALFDDPILANSALDRFAHSAHQVVMEGESYRKRNAPGAGRGVKA